MVFANITYEDKQAFFSLLDEYFASRPHLASSSGGGGAQGSPTSPTIGQSLNSLSRLLPPSRSPAPPSPASPPSSASPTSSYNNGNATGNGAGGQPQPDMAQRFISSSIKYGTAGTKSSIGAISRNKDAMDLLGKVGAAGMVKGANDRINPQKEVQGGAYIVEENGSGSAGSTGKAKPTPPAKKGGVAGLISGKTFGHVDTSSKMSAFTSMWKDPQKVQAPTVEHHMAPALSTKHASMPPPLRRDGSGTSARSTPPPVAAVAAVAVVEETQGGQAKALYDYTGSDSGDLPVQSGQIVNVIEKTSADWWTCEDGNGRRGLVPSNYLEDI